jgi:hypothetical protein
MAIIGNTRFVERNRFFNGQRLFASDLQSVEELNRQMRWLHNQSLHQPGIGAGYAISGNKGDRQVSISPGYAIDAQGREIVLADASVQPVPPVSDDGFGGPVFFDLTVSYPDERTLAVAETRDGTCGAARGAVRLREAPVFCWVKLSTADRMPEAAEIATALQSGMVLRLARAQVRNCQLDQPLSLAQRRNAKLAEQPYVASAHSGPLKWQLSDTGTPVGVGIQVIASIDATSAGFRTTPSFSAQLMGSREFVFDLEGGKQVTRVLDGFVTLLAPKAAGFDFSLLIPDALLNTDPTGPNPQDGDALRDQVVHRARKQWTVDWIGVEG